MVSRDRLGVTTAVAVVLLSAGCWPAVGAGPDRRSHNPFETAITTASVASLEVAWTATVDGSVGDPVTSRNGVHVAASGTYHGFDAATGAVRWSYEPVLAFTNQVAPPIAEFDRVLTSWGAKWSEAGTWASEVLWLDATTGEPVSGTDVAPGIVWGQRSGRFASTAESGGIAIPPGLAKIGVTDTTSPSNSWLLAVNASWQHSADQGLVTLGAHRLYYAGQAADSTGPWDPSDPWRDPWILSDGVRAFTLAPPAVCPLWIYYGGSNLLSIDTPCPSWATATDSRPTSAPVLSVGETTLFVVTELGTLYALDATDGDVLWTASLGAGAGAPALADGTLFVAVAGGDLVALPAGGCGAPTCSASWRAPLGTDGRQPAVAGGVVFVGTEAGALHAVDTAGCSAATCPSLWQHDLGAALTGGPAVSNGQVYVGTADGRLVAFALPD